MAKSSLVHDQNNVAIQSGTNFLTADISTPPKNSPLAYSSSVLTIVPPAGAIELILNPSTNLRVGEAVAMTTYDVVASGTKEAIPVSRMSAVYIVRDSADGTVNFRFTVV